MKVSNEAVRQQWRTDGARSEEPELADHWMNLAEGWADAMEPALDSGTPIVNVALTALTDTVPRTGALGLFDHGCDFMVDYLTATWLYGATLRIWYDSDRPA